MNIIDYFKNKIGRYLLNNASKKTTQNIIQPAFDDIIEIGIVYQANEKTNEDKINAFANELREQGKKVFILGYLNAKTLPESKKFMLHSEYFWKGSLTGFNLPDRTRINRFLSSPFDLLINLYFEDELPMQAVSTYSSAKYRIGAQIPKALNYNDTIIDTLNNKDIQNLAKQIIHYLKVVNRK